MTPIRYLSDDGICAIDIQFHTGEGAIGDTSNGEIISWYAKTILRDCVAKEQRGGAIHGFSKWVMPNEQPPTVHL